MLHYCLRSLERDEVAPIDSYTLAVASPFIELGSLPTNVPRFLPTCIARLESGTKMKLRGECLRDDSSFFRTRSRHVYLRATWKSCDWLKTKVRTSLILLPSADFLQVPESTRRLMEGN